MPIYEFRCPNCGHVFEELIFRQSEIEELTCPTCGSQGINRLMSSFASGGSSRSEGGGSTSRSCGPGSFS